MVGALGVGADCDEADANGAPAMPMVDTADSAAKKEPFFLIFLIFENLGLACAIRGVINQFALVSRDLRRTEKSN
jgi:hypothetical protein